MMRFDHRVSAITLSVVALFGMTVASVVLYMAGASMLLAFAFAATQAAAYGVTCILKPVVTVESLGCTGFGAISGLLAMPNLAGFAIAPLVGAALARINGYRLSIVAAECMALVGLALVTRLAQIMRRTRAAIEVERNR